MRVRATVLMTMVVTLLLVWPVAGAGAAVSITAVPSTGLVDGQLVTVTVSGTPPSAFVFVSVCPAGSPISFVDRCDVGSATLGTSNANGVFVVQVAVHAGFDPLLGGPIGCRTAAATCVMGAGLNPDDGPEVSVPLAFGPTSTSTSTSTIGSTTQVSLGGATVAPSTRVRATAAQPRFTG